MPRVKLLLAGGILIMVVQACTTGGVSPVAPADTEMPTLPPDLPQVELPEILDFRMIDANHGWGMTQTLILRTNDGGLTWYNLTPQGISVEGFFNIYALDTLTFWALVSGPDPMGDGTLYHTINGGLTWEAYTVPLSLVLWHFADQNNGFAMQDLGAALGSQGVAIYRTVNGGETWQVVFQHEPGALVDSSLPFSGIKTGITFRDALHGWVCGNIPMNNYVYLYATQDGGATWFEQNPTLLPEYAGFFAEANSPVFFSSNEGVLPVKVMSDRIALLFYTTSDGGASWIPGRSLITYGSYAIATPRDYFVWDGGPNLNATHDAGISWEVVHPNIDLSATLARLQFVDGTTGWALETPDGIHTSLYRTTDGGATWMQLIP